MLVRINDILPITTNKARGKVQENMMRILKMMLITLILGGLAVPLLSCASKSDEAGTAKNQIATVQRGDLTLDITAVGNLALSRTEDLAFETAGTVKDVLVQAGDPVEEGQILATLDTSEWQDQLTILERALTAKERALPKAQLSVQTAEYNLSTIKEVQEAQDVVDNAEYDVRIAKEMHIWGLASGAPDAYLTNMLKQIDAAKERVAEAKKDLAEILAGKSGVVTTDVATQVALKQLQVGTAQGDVEDARIAIEDAQKALDDAKSASPEVKAPFAGFVTKIGVTGTGKNISGGDEIKKGTIVVQIADPTKFEADILVSEMDIFQVKLGGDASVQLSAMPGISLPAKVTRISPTATIQSGVVNYQVTVEIQPQGVSSQSGTATPGRRTQSSQRASSTVTENFQLREGLTATVSILVQQKTNVLLVPNGAITSRGGQTSVQVSLPDGTIAKRTIQTGISNYQYTEVIDGLSEGEKVVVPQGTTTTPTTQLPRGPMPFFGPR